MLDVEIMSKLFTVGPVMMHPDILQESGEQLPYFRTEEFSNMMLESESILKELLGASPDSKVAFLTASGTGAMEAAVTNVFEKSDRLLIIDGGGFGKRFVEICEVHKIAHDVVKLEYGQTLCEGDLFPFKDKNYAGLLVNIDETSTGQLYNKHILSDFCRSKGMLLVVDAISSFLADEIHMDCDGFDVVIISSQKALSLAPGLSMVVMNSRVYGERVEKIESPIYYLNLKKHIENQARGQTPFTPAVGVLIGLHTTLLDIRDSGIDSRIARTVDLSRYFREKATGRGLVIPTYPLSNALTPVLFEKGAYSLYQRLKDEYGLVVTPSGGDLADTMIRVGHMGNLEESDYDVLVDAIKEIVG